MIIQYDSKKEYISDSIFGILFFGAITLFAYFESNYYIFVLGLFMSVASLFAVQIYRYKTCFNHINVHIDTDNRVIHVGISSEKAKDNIIQNIPFNEIHNVKLKLATGKSGKDYIEFYANNDFSFSMPIHHNQIKELEKFFNIQYSTLYGKEDNSEKIKKLYTLGFLGSMSSAKGYFLYLLFGFLFILNIGILIPLAQYIYNLNLGDTYISLACGTEIVIFFIVIILLWKKFR